jgi:hypothetical protein
LIQDAGRVPEAKDGITVANERPLWRKIIRWRAEGSDKRLGYSYIFLKAVRMKRLSNTRILMMNPIPQGQ